MDEELAEPLARLPEAELMDAVEHAAAYADADFNEPHTAFVEQFAQRFSEFRTGHVLDLGCGPADVTVRFAKRYPLVQVTAIDGSAAMLDLAKARVDAEGLGSRIALELVYLPDARLLTRTFDGIISNSLLHHMSDPLALWEVIVALPKNAPVWIVDLLRPTSNEMLEELVDRYAKDEHPLLIEDFANSLRAAYRPAEIAEQLRAMQLAHLNIETISDRHVAIWGWR